MRTIPVYTARELLDTPERIDAATRLLSIVIVRHMAAGVTLSALARRWGRHARGLTVLAEYARVELAYRLRGTKPENRKLFIPDPVSLATLTGDTDTCVRHLDAMQQEVEAALNDARTRDLILAMLKPEPPALYFPKASRGAAKSKRIEAGPRGRGRPKGSPNKPKGDMDETGWLMPDGRRVQL